MMGLSFVKLSSSLPEKNAAAQKTHQIIFLRYSYRKIHVYIETAKIIFFVIAFKDNCSLQFSFRTLFSFSSFSLDAQN